MPTGKYKRTEEWKRRVYGNKERNRKISDAKKAEKNPNWKGDNAKYRAIHTWISYNYGKANKCENNEKHKGLFVWANISGKYLRDITDYKMLCQKCHMHEHWNAKIKEKKEMIIKRIQEKRWV